MATDTSDIDTAVQNACSTENTAAQYTGAFKQANLWLLADIAKSLRRMAAAEEAMVPYATQQAPTTPSAAPPA